MSLLVFLEKEIKFRVIPDIIIHEKLEICSIDLTNGEMVKSDLKLWFND